MWDNTTTSTCSSSSSPPTRSSSSASSAASSSSEDTSEYTTNNIISNSSNSDSNSDNNSNSHLKKDQLLQLQAQLKESDMARSVKAPDKLVDSGNNDNHNHNHNNNTNNTYNDNHKNDKNDIYKTQRRIAVLYMTLAMSVHFAGHEFTRSPTMSMFTSKEMGFESSATLPLAVGLVSPFSMVLLWLYNRTLNRYGSHSPKYALIQSTLMVSSFLFIVGCSLYYITSTSGSSHHLLGHGGHGDIGMNMKKNIHMDMNMNTNTNTNMYMSHDAKRFLSKCLLFAAFVYQSANVQFLYTQHWSFIGSVLSPEEVASSGSLISGIGSVTSTFAAAYVSTLVEKIGLIGSQCTAALIIGSSAFFANKAYQIASKYDFAPKHDVHVHHHRNNHNDTSDSNNVSGSGSGSSNKADSNTEKQSSIEKNDIVSHVNYNNNGNINGNGNNNGISNDCDNDKKHHTIDRRDDFGGDSKIKDKKRILKGSGENIIQTARRLFRRVPILGAMFCEVLIAQCLSSLLNFQFVTEVKNTIIDDEERAGFTGNCYAWVNGVSGALQFFILPFVVKRIGARWMWLIMPIIMLTLTSLQFYSQNPSLTLVGLTFLTMKTIEYSLRGQASEMVWVMLDYESRFIGKELINLFANRLGKSSTAIFLFVLTMQIEKDGNHLRRFSINASVILACLWFLCTIRVSRLIPSKKIAA